MRTEHQQFATDLTQTLLLAKNKLTVDPDNSNQLLASKSDNEQARLDLTPVLATAHPVTASAYFSGIITSQGLLTAYHQCRKDTLFEDSLPEAMQHVHAYAEQFLQRILNHAQSDLTDDEASLIAQFASNLDCYSAIKAIESLLNSHADRVLLDIARQQNWIVYMDHLAIRCGSQQYGDAQRITDYLCQHHGYVSPQAEGQDFYQFDDGWDAYPVYKMLDNGQMMRLFIDESSTGNTSQIIQHWNHTYGYTAHHLALRVCQFTETGLTALPLYDVISALQMRGVKCMPPTGAYTSGLLEQVFTQPAHTPDVPEQIKQQLSSFDKGLEKVIQNGKLIELVSRREMPAEYAKQYFALYELSYDASNPNHSAPCYNYFLPAQAAHVIRTSIDVT